MSYDDGRKLGKGERPQFFNKLEIHKDDMTLTVQYDPDANESMVVKPGERTEDIYIKFEDHHTGKVFDQKIHLLELMLILRQYIGEVKHWESCSGCRYMRLAEWSGPGEDGIGFKAWPEWPHCSLKSMKPIPPEIYNEYKIPDWCPCPNCKDRINEFMAMGLPVKDGSNPFEGNEGGGCSGCGSCGSCGGGCDGGTVH